MGPVPVETWLLHLLEVLACPACKGVLELGGPSLEALCCKACRQAWPVREGVPDLLPESAEPQPPSAD